MPRYKRIPQIEPDENLEEMANTMMRLVERRVEANATFEQRQRAAQAVVADLMWVHEDRELRALVTDAEAMEVDGVVYRRLSQASSSTLHGMYGTHVIEESLYRETGVRNGPTVKPIELVVGAVSGSMLPAFARAAGFLHGHMDSRELERALEELGFRPPSRSFIDKHLRTMGSELAERAADLEEAAREAEAAEAGDAPVPASLTCGLDRMAVRMDEPLPEPEASERAAELRRKRSTPYERQPPPPAEYNWRMAWVGSLCALDADGNVLQTWRYAADAQTEPIALAQRVTADVEVLVERYPGIPVTCVQDGAKELGALPTGLHHELADRDLSELPAELSMVSSNDGVYALTDFHHLLTYLDAVVATCEPAGDPNDMRGWYRGELLSDDGAIDRILRKLRREHRKRLDAENDESAGTKALAKAISYIRKRRATMRYASLHARKLAIGSGATESTCALMQVRVKRPGMAWEVPGLRSAMTTRALVLSGRWGPAWETYAASKRRVVRAA